MRVSHFSPMPPERTGIADYSALLLPALDKQLDVRRMRRGARRPARGTDASLYHIGNNPEAHGWILRALQRHPSLVVLHEVVVHHLIAGLTLGKRNGTAYIEAMEREAGVVGRLLAHGVIDGVVRPALGDAAAGFSARRGGARSRHGPHRALGLRRGRVS